MAENNNNSNNQSKNPLSGGGKSGKPKFNFYWIYGIMAAIFIGLTFFGSNTTSKDTDWGLVNQMLSNGDVEKIILVNKEVAEIYIKKDKKSNYELDKEGNSLSTTPDFVYQIGSQETFEKRVQDAQKNLPDPIYIRNESRQDWGKDIFGWVFPILLLVGVWFFIMRMMSKGGAGGGQIFNIGK